MGISLNQALMQRRTVREFTGSAIKASALKKLIWAAQGVSGENGKRTTPSAHALYPLRLFVVVNRVEGFDTGLYSVEPDSLDLKIVSHADLQFSLRDAAIGHPAWVTEAACILVICADMATPGRAFAEQRPYGARGERYVYMEAGAAAQNIQLQSVEEGLGSVWVGGFNDEATADILDLPAPLAPLILMCVGDPVAER